eukprot:2367928-Rhodomonas_salina.6
MAQEARRTITGSGYSDSSQALHSTPVHRQYSQPPAPLSPRLLLVLTPDPSPHPSLPAKEGGSVPGIARA